MPTKDEVTTTSDRTATVAPRFDHLEFCALADAEIGRFAHFVRAADLDLRVPWSRTWRVRDLVHHVGAVHRWATRLVALDARRYAPVRETDDWPPNPTAPAAAGWLTKGRMRLVSTLEAADPDRKMWAWGADQHVRFWSRRMTHETAVHRADLELALGQAPQFAPQLAADGVSEFFENLWRARAWKRGMGALRGTGQAIAFSAPDIGERWRVVRTATGFDWTHHLRGRGGPRADVTVSAPVGLLYLLVWKRSDAHAKGVRIRGDETLLEHWRRYSSV